MVSVKEIYGASDLLSAKNFPDGPPQQVTIEGFKVEAVREGDKPKIVLAVKSDKWDGVRRFALNKTNAEKLAKRIGTEDYTTWIGKTFRLVRDETKFQGQMVPCLSVVMWD